MPTTNTSSIGSATRDYISVSTWEADTDNNLVSLDVIEVGELYNDSTFTHTAEVIIVGATTDTARYRVLRAASGEDPLIDYTGTSGNVFRIVESNFRAERFKILVSGGHNALQGFRVAGGPTGVIVDGVVLESTGTTWIAFYSITSTTVLDCRNCIAYMTGSGTLWTGFQEGSGTMTCHNCISDNATTYGFNNGIVCVNCISVNSGTSDFNGVTETYCCSSDTSATGTGSIDSETDTDLFEDPAGEDYRLKAGSAAIDAGDDLSGTFTESIESGVDHGDASGDWNMGPYDGFVSAGGADVGHLGVVYHRRAMAHNLVR